MSLFVGMDVRLFVCVCASECLCASDPWTLLPGRSSFTVGEEGGMRHQMIRDIMVPL